MELNSGEDTIWGGKVRRSRVPLIVLAALLLAVFATTYAVYRYSRDNEELLLRTTAVEVASAIEVRLSAHYALLRGGAGFYDAKMNFNGQSWRTYVNAIDLPTVYPELQGIGIAQRVRPGELGSFEAFIRRTWLPTFDVRPGYTREEYFPITYLEPLDERNLAALGYDMWSEPVRREAMERARDTGEPAMSGKVTLIQEIYADKQAGFLIYFPLYKGGAATLQERRDNHMGYVYIPIRADDFTRAALDAEELDADITIRIYDGSDRNADDLLYQKDGALRLPAAVHASHVMNAAGRELVVALDAPRGFSGTAAKMTAPYIFLGGLMLSFIIFMLTRSQIRARQEAERSARRLAIVLEAGRMLASSLDYNQTLRNIGRAMVPRAADWCLVDLVDESGRAVPVVTANADPEKEKWGAGFRAGRTTDLNAPAGIGAVIRTGVTEYTPKLTEAVLMSSASSPEIEMAKKIGIKSVICAPILARGKATGAITLVSTRDDLFYTREDVSMVESIAARVSLAIQNAKLFDDLKKAVNIRDEFMATASHELKTPLTSQKILIGYLKRIMEQAGDAKYIEHLDKLDAQTERLTRLIVDLIDVAKIEAGKLRLDIRDIDLDKVVAAVVEDAKMIASNHSIIVTGEINRSLRADAERVQQVVMNLLTNAIKYSPKASSVEVALSTVGEEAKISVRDYGIGIDEEHQKRLFERFFRVGGTDEKTFPGMGLGLFISAEIVRSHGGRIWVESRKGDGSTFSFTLPLS